MYLCAACHAFTLQEKLNEHCGSDLRWKVVCSKINSKEKTTKFRNVSDNGYLD